MTWEKAGKVIQTLGRKSIPPKEAVLVEHPTRAGREAFRPAWPERALDQREFRANLERLIEASLAGGQPCLGP